jgi:DNA-binding XRE family transcriptional regulator
LDRSSNLLNKQSTKEHLADHYTEEDAEKFNELKRSLSFVGDIVKRRRLALDVPQAKLAEASEVNRWTISQLESGRDVSLSSLRKILLGLTNLDICKQIVDARVKERASK